MMIFKWISIGLLTLSGLIVYVDTIEPDFKNLAKKLGFNDPAGHVYWVTASNQNSMTTETTHRSIIRVTRAKSSGTGKSKLEEIIQKLPFNPTIVDFDLHCQENHCYLVVITSRSKRNVELYAWKRTQFDRVAEKDSFAKPFGVKLFKIQSSFYVAIAQQQIHLKPYRSLQDYEDSPRFIGCAIFKFTRVNSNHVNIRYHQFIRLPFEPLYVNHFTSINSNNVTAMSTNTLQENHYLVFSVESNWTETPQSYTFVWSPISDYFWPYKLPQGVVVGPSPPGSQYPILKFQGEQPPTMNVSQQQPGLNLTHQVPYQDRIGPVEMCFSQLQRLLNERDIRMRQLIEISSSIWHKKQTSQSSFTNISSRVIVNGNVIVQGSMIESPQISLIGGRNETITINQIDSDLNNFSPFVVETKLRQATYRLRDVREKISQAVTISTTTTFENTTRQFNSPIKFLGPIIADKVIFSNGISNSNVRLNGISFKQLEYELVSLSGFQDIGATVKFTGTVTADLLEIDGKINGQYYLKDAFDITSNSMQVFNLFPSEGSPVLHFRHVTTPELGLSYNATFNYIRLDDFVTKDNRTQIIVGRKTFKRLFMRKLSLANPNTLLNGYNIGDIALHGIRLSNPTNRAQYFTSEQLIFTRGIQVNRLVINGLINRQINISSLLYDSVKTFDSRPQDIFNYKRFLNGLTISNLLTDGAINDVIIQQLFNLNPTPPISDYLKYPNQQPPISGNFVFEAPVYADGSLNIQRLNGVDMMAGAVRRWSPPVPGAVNASMLNIQAQTITGRKIFAKPLRVDRLKLLHPPQQFAQQLPYPLVNGLDIRRIKAGLQRQRENPPLIYIDNLVIDGNLNVQTSWNKSDPIRTTFGNHSVCRLDVIRHKLVTTGAEEQFITAPVKIKSLRGKSIYLEPNALNGLTFPNDFVLKSIPGYQDVPDRIQSVYGHKSFDNLMMAPSLPINLINNRLGPRFALDPFKLSHQSNIVFGTRSNINDITFNELQTFILHERQKNSTGETVLQTLTVHGQIYASRINNNYWPADIILKSVGSNRGPVPPQLNRRIYSPLIFTETANLNVRSQLILRGPIQLMGRLNEVNLTEFAHQSVTRGDKDLMMVGRPLRNKFFMGGLTVNGEIRSQGFIDDVNFEEMKNRVVTITPRLGQTTSISGHKIFMSDVIFKGQLSVPYLNDLPMDAYLSRAQMHQEGDLIQVRGKKTITGTLKVSKNLVVAGLINGIDFADLRTRAISLSPASNKIDFNKTLTIEGDAFMDNLWIDEKDGVLDGVRLSSLLPIQSSPSKDYIVQRPNIVKRNLTQSYELTGLVLDCNIICSLDPQPPNLTIPQLLQQPPPPYLDLPTKPIEPSQFVTQPSMPYPSRRIQYNGKNITNMRTTPPYVSNYHSYPLESMKRNIARPDYTKNIQSLALRQPFAIRYETPTVVRHHNTTSIAKSSIVLERLILLRKEIVSLNLIQSFTSNNIVVGFIEAPTINVGSLIWSEKKSQLHVVPSTLLHLDQINFPFGRSIYRLKVGVSTNSDGTTSTKVVSVVGENEARTLTELPVDSPNNAKFLIAEPLALFLLVSTDYTTTVNKHQGLQCPRVINHRPTITAEYADSLNQKLGGIHVYLFHVYHNSSSRHSTYFDLYQSIDLPAIDSFESFNFRGSTYALAVSKATDRVYLLILRGYSGFEIVSYINTPSLEKVKVAHTLDGRPVLVINQSTGHHIVMESVII